MKQLIDLISNFVEFTGYNIVDSIILFFINLVSGSVAFGLVGMIFDTCGKYDSDLMSDFHWGIRFLIFLALDFILTEFFKLVSWIFSFQWWIYLIAFALILTVVFIVFYLKYKYQKKHKSVLVETQYIPITNKSENIIFIKENQDKYYCPRCHSKLVKRHGPYGDFYGCSSYGTTGCRYTRKRL